eukprot:scaffold996_cov409-Prasinococcus_capsulatus_cf.AAC.28
MGHRTPNEAQTRVAYPKKVDDLTADTAAVDSVWMGFANARLWLNMQKGTKKIGKCTGNVRWNAWKALQMQCLQHSGV